MTRELPGWPDVERLLAEVLADLTPGTEVGTDLPEDLQDRLPLQRVKKIGGAGDDITDVARVDVEAYAFTREQAVPLAEAQRQRIIAAPHRTAAGLIDRVRTEVGPHRMPYTDPAIVLLQATYRISVRRWSAVPYVLPTT